MSTGGCGNNVVNLWVEREVRKREVADEQVVLVWQCPCGDTAFELRDGGAISCADCGEITDMRWR